MIVSSSSNSAANTRLVIPASMLNNGSKLILKTSDASECIMTWYVTASLMTDCVAYRFANKDCGQYHSYDSVNVKLWLLV